MSGINRIQTKREVRYQGGDDNRIPGREIFFKDGDQAFMIPVATGDEGDTNLDEIYLYTFRQGNRCLFFRVSFKISWDESNHPKIRSLP